jgi:hypothetical protein
MVTIWIIINAIIVLAMVVWSFLHETDGITQYATFFSQVAVVFILLNINMYFIFLIIRKSKRRKVKLTLAKLSRKIMKLHVPIAILATSLICIHILLIIRNAQLDFANMKMLTGLIATCTLILTLFAGFFRSRKATGIRRKFHIFSAFFFFLLVLLHIFTV